MLRILHTLTVAWVVLGLMLPCPCDHDEAASAETSCCSNTLVDVADAEPSDEASHEACSHCEDDHYVAPAVDLAFHTVIVDEPVIPPPLVRSVAALTEPSSAARLREQHQRPPPQPESLWIETRPTQPRLSTWLC